MIFHQDIHRFLIENEEIQKEWASKEYDGIYATQYRVMFVKGGTFNKKFIEVSYNHIPSIEFSKIRPKERLIGAIICFVLSIFTLYISNFFYPLSFYRGFGRPIYGIEIPAFLILLGIGLLIWFIIGVNKYIIYINGRKPITVSKELNELIIFVREKINS